MWLAAAAYQLESTNSCTLLKSNNVELVQYWDGIVLLRYFLCTTVPMYVTGSPFFDCVH